MAALVGSLDAGTSSIRFTVYNLEQQPIESHQMPLESINPKEGYGHLYPSSLKVGLFDFAVNFFSLIQLLVFSFLDGLSKIRS